MHFLVVQFETQSTNAWVDAEPDAVIEEAQELLGRSGWGALWLSECSALSQVESLPHTLLN